MYFSEWKVLYLIEIALKILPKDPMDKNPPNRRQAIIWTAIDPIPWRK